MKRLGTLVVLLFVLAVLCGLLSTCNSGGGHNQDYRSPAKTDLAGTADMVAGQVGDIFMAVVRIVTGVGRLAAQMGTESPLLLGMLLCLAAPLSILGLVVLLNLRSILGLLVFRDTVHSAASFFKDL